MFAVFVKYSPANDDSAFARIDGGIKFHKPRNAVFDDTFLPKARISHAERVTFAFYSHDFHHACVEKLLINLHSAAATARLTTPATGAQVEANIVQPKGRQAHLKRVKCDKTIDGSQLKVIWFDTSNIMWGGFSQTLRQVGNVADKLATN